MDNRQPRPLHWQIDGDLPGRGQTPIGRPAVHRQPGRFNLQIQIDVNSSGSSADDVANYPLPVPSTSISKKHDQEIHVGNPIDRPVKPASGYKKPENGSVYHPNSQDTSKTHQSFNTPFGVVDVYNQSNGILIDFKPSGGPQQPSKNEDKARYNNQLPKHWDSLSENPSIEEY